MHNLFLVEEAYKKFVKDLSKFIPEGFYNVDLDLLYKFDLLHFQPQPVKREESVSRYFQIVETKEKITLINEQFIVWIIPSRINNIPVTYTLIAMNKGDNEPQLETSFVTSGIYNSSRLVLKILEKFLGEIQENETLLSKLAI